MKKSRLYASQVTRAHLPKKSLGQNFLMHARIAERIADAAGLSKEETVLEIGPGTGMLTRALLARVARVVAVEADHELVRGLEETFAAEIGEGRLQLINGDIRSFDPASITESYALVANIPYYITGEIIRMFLTTEHKPSSMTLLVQKEVAERIARSKKESLLSLSVKAYGMPKYQFTVPRGAFLPAPNVDSAVLSITDIRTDAFASKTEEERFFDILHAGFAHKRKLLIRNLEAVAIPERIHAAFTAAGVAEKARSEDLALAQWKKIASGL
jgi:16S rRNA (adenine1518-N6/adenine1519-N6)-dimethyltransferase